jgi:hypothetical protein
MASNEQDDQQHNEGAIRSPCEGHYLPRQAPEGLNGCMQTSEPPIHEHQSSLSIPAVMLASLVVDLWKISERAKIEPVAERVLAACERAEERLRRIGFEIEEMAGRPYDTNMRVHVVEHDGGEEPWSISECLSPAIYYRGELIREADVITKGV